MWRTAAVVNGNRGLQKSTSWTAGGGFPPQVLCRGGHMVGWQPISMLRPPRCLAPPSPLAGLSCLQLSGGRGVEKEEGSGDSKEGREGGKEGGVVFRGNE